MRPALVVSGAGAGVGGAADGRAHCVGAAGGEEDDLGDGETSLREAR